MALFWHPFPEMPCCCWSYFHLDWWGWSSFFLLFQLVECRLQTWDHYKDLRLQYHGFSTPGGPLSPLDDTFAKEFLRLSGILDSYWSNKYKVQKILLLLSRLTLFRLSTVSWRPSAGWWNPWLGISPLLFVIAWNLSFSSLFQLDPVPIWRFLL